MSGVDDLRAMAIRASGRRRIDALIAAVREEEREACAAVVDEYGAGRLSSARDPLDSGRYESILVNVTAHNIAARIRARGKGA